MDPVTSSALAKAADSASRDARGLLSRVLGPAADEVAEALRRYTAYRVGNVARIAENADRKSRGLEGQVNPRVAHRVLDDGSYCDDELMVEYLGGLLAGSRTPAGRDDRAIYWTAQVSSMSVLQIRAHYLLYREWASALKGHHEVNFGHTVRAHVAELHTPVDPFTSTLRGAESDVPEQEALEHSLSGLYAAGLIGGWGIGDREGIGRKESRYEQLLFAQPTSMGAELYGWACGQQGLTASAFVQRATVLDGPDIERLREVHLPNLVSDPAS